MKLLVAVLLLVSSVVASAQTRIVSIDAFDLSYTGGISLKSDNAAKGSDRDVTTFKFNLNYAQNLPQYAGLMWKARFYFNREEVDWGAGDSESSAFGGAGGLIYNFSPENIKNSIMVGAMVGLERATYEYGNSDDESGFNWFLDLEAGKRWDLGQYSVANISYAPTISLNLKRYGGDIRDDYFKNGSELKLNFLKFDILF